MAAGLSPFFEPASVVIVGGSSIPGKSGYEVIRNILANGYQGRLYVVNPRPGTVVQGVPVHASIADLPDGVELAIISIPAEACVQAVRECAAKGIGHVILLAGGFAEVDQNRAHIQEELATAVHETGIRVIGPNTSGLISTPHRFAPSLFPLGLVRRGRVSYIAQTGNFATHTLASILSNEHFGVCRVIGLGNKVDIDECDALEYLSQDDETAAIAMYLESFKRPRRFLEVARGVTRAKPVVMLKGGASEAGKKAAIAHTAALSAEDRLVDGMLRQAGVVRIHDYTALIHAGKALSMIPLPRGNRVGFLAPSGAMLVVLTDLCARLGLQVPELGERSLRRLQEISPPFIRLRNPVDIWGAVGLKGIEEGYKAGMEILLEDPEVDSIVVVLMLTEETGVPSFDFIPGLSDRFREKPILVTFSGQERLMTACKRSVEPAGVPTFIEIEEPFEVLATLARCRRAMSRPL